MGWFLLGVSLNLCIQPSASSQPSMPCCLALQSFISTTGVAISLVSPSRLHTPNVTTYLLSAISWWSARAKVLRLSKSDSSSPTMYSSTNMPSFSQGECGNTLVTLSAQSVILVTLMRAPKWLLEMGMVSARREQSRMEKTQRVTQLLHFLSYWGEGLTMKSVKGCSLCSSQGASSWTTLQPSAGNLSASYLCCELPIK